VTWRLLLAFLTAGVTIWIVPLLGLGEFTVLGQLCLAIVVLSVLDVVFRRLL
jgi:hypothetical protein